MNFSGTLFPILFRLDPVQITTPVSVAKSVPELPLRSCRRQNNVAEADAKVIIEVRVPAQVDDAAGKTEASTVLEKEDTIAIYGSNEFAAKAIINANGGFSESKLGADKILAVGFDSGALQQDAIRKGIFVGSVTQDPIQIGYQAVKLAVEAAQGKEVKDVDTGSKWYDAKNIDSAQ